MRFIVQARPDLGLSPDRAYLAGLFADVGAPFLLKTITGLAPRAPFNEVMSAAAEAHTLIGELMAQAWSLPGECAVAARRHHEPGMLEKAHPVLLCAWAAESVCHQLGIAGDPSPVPYQEEAVKLLNLTAAGRALLLGKTNAYLDELGASIEALPES